MAFWNKNKFESQLQDQREVLLAELARAEQDKEDLLAQIPSPRYSMDEDRIRELDERINKIKAEIQQEEAA
jgi:hypothetical protein